MMFVSRYLLPLPAIRALRMTDTYSLHRVAYSLFEDVRKGASSGILFADKGRDRRGWTMLLLSDRRPRQPELGELDVRELPEAYLAFPRYRFEVLVNPVRRISATGKHEAVRGREGVTSWFLGKAPGWGFRVEEASFQVDKISVDCFRKGDATVTLGKALVHGILEVTDRETFARSVCHGIGRGKAFGCGLLQIVPHLL